MHANEVTTSASLIHDLITAQFPEYADLPISAVLPSGTDNALYRLGDGLVARLPRLADKEQRLEKEYKWLPELAPHLPLSIPKPVALGYPSNNYPFKWAIYEWLEGQPASEVQFSSPNDVANELADFIVALQRIDTTDAPMPKTDFDRGLPLKRRDQYTRQAIIALKDRFDVQALNSEWERALKVEPWQGAPVWVHGDLDGRNMLAQNDHLSAIIDFGSLGVGDPAYDVMVAWKIFTGGSRSAFKAKLDPDEATWMRSRGLALSQAVMILSYYTEETNLTLVKEARNWMKELGFQSQQ